MPLGIQRLNARRAQPNPSIVFLKPLPGPTSALALTYLERIAAICTPIMRAHHLAVMSLEEYPPNPEFVGRNFNAGEVIQLVLKAPYTGHWLPFRHVQMVMMHELAHCKEMNHSKSFWKVRNAFADELRELWGRDYTGEGMWSRGRMVENGEFVMGAGAGEGEEMAHAICGGTFRSRRRGGRKRKREGQGQGERPKVSYAERQQRRIARKFGTGGVALGGDEVGRERLEAGQGKKRKVGKPKVAGSARGRELRAAAALARFQEGGSDEVGVKGEGMVEEVEEKEEKKEEMSGSETESEYEDGDVKVKAEPEDDAVDLNGERILDAKGRGMVKVCEDEDEANEDVKREMRELQDVDTPGLSQTERVVKDEEEESPFKEVKKARDRPLKTRAPIQKDSEAVAKLDQPLTTTVPPTDTSCPVCTTLNASTSPTCSSCSHVLLPSLDPGHWRCASAACKDSIYINAGDCGVCGICGERRPARESKN